jgi:2-oxoglutarate dehydrogenase E1 component
VVWVQEEPENMGAWDFARPSIEGLAGNRRVAVLARPRSSSPAEGSAARHAQVQQELLALALTKFDVQSAKVETRGKEKRQ